MSAYTGCTLPGAGKSDWLSRKVSSDVRLVYLREAFTDFFYIFSNNFTTFNIRGTDRSNAMHSSKNVVPYATVEWLSTWICNTDKIYSIKLYVIREISANGNKLKQLFNMDRCTPMYQWVFTSRKVPDSEQIFMTSKIKITTGGWSSAMSGINNICVELGSHCV